MNEMLRPVPLGVEQRRNLAAMGELIECKYLCNSLLEKIKNLEGQNSYTSDEYLEINHIRAVLSELTR